MNVVHKVTGYDKLTEHLELKFDVSAEQIECLQRFSNVSTPYNEVMGSIELNDGAETELARLFEMRMERVGGYTWFIEPFANGEQFDDGVTK